MDIDDSVNEIGRVAFVSPGRAVRRLAEDVGSRHLNDSGCSSATLD
jgi:hypothetical protein